MKSNRKTMEAIFQAKQKRRKVLRKLSIEEKVKILVQLQKIAVPIFLSRGFKRAAWKI